MPLSGRTRGGVYAPSTGGGGGAAPVTPANAGGALSSRSRGVYGAGIGSAVKGGKSAAADPASTPLTLQVSLRTGMKGMGVSPMQQQAHPRLGDFK